MFFPNVILTAAALTVATYNVENYLPASRRTAGGFQSGYPKPEAEKRALRQVIEGLRADVLALQEMGGPAYLEELRSDLKVEGLDYPFGAVGQGEDAERHLALLSRLPVRGWRCERVSFSYSPGGREWVKRGLLEAEIETPAGSLTVFVVHLKSHLSEREDDTESAARREGEAAAVRDRILHWFPRPEEGRYILLGDCNDAAASATVRRLTRRGKTLLAVRLPAADSRGETWTEYYRRKDIYCVLDHIFLSPGLRRTAPARATIYDGDGSMAASDHRPLAVTLDLSAAKP